MKFKIEVEMLMKFRIKGDKEKIKAHLDEFIRMTKEEYTKQTKKTNILAPLGVKVPIIPFDMGYMERDEHIILWDTFNVPNQLQWFFKRVRQKMEKNLTGYFKEHGIKVNVKAIK